MDIRPQSFENKATVTDFEVEFFDAPTVYPVEHSPVRGEGVRADATSGRHRALHPVRLQRL